MRFDELNFYDIADTLLFTERKVNFSEIYKFKIRKQNGLPDCSIHAWINCIEYLRQIDGYDYETFSVVYHYYMSRILEGHESELSGVYIETSLESLFINGAINSHGKPKSLEEITTKPSNKTIDEARKRIINKSISGKVLELNINVFKYVISELGVPFVAVVNASISKLHDKNPNIFIEDQVDGEINDEKKGLHAICIVGYDDDEEVLLFQNSYGSDWHYNGFGKIHYSYINNFTKALAIEKSCIKDDESDELIVDDYCYILDHLINMIK